MAQISARFTAQLHHSSAYDGKPKDSHQVDRKHVDGEPHPGAHATLDGHVDREMRPKSGVEKVVHMMQRRSPKFVSQRRTRLTGST